MLDVVNTVGNYNDLNELIYGVLMESVPIPTKPYYVNYDVVVCNYTSNGNAYVNSSYYIGPYPKSLAEFLLEHWVSIHNTTSNPHIGCYTVVKTATIALKPKKGTVIGVAPTKGQIRAMLLPVLIKQLEVYRELLYINDITQT